MSQVTQRLLRRKMPTAIIDEPMDRCLYINCIYFKSMNECPEENAYRHYL